MYRPTADEIIHLFKLQTHPEGGFFQESYRSKTQLTNLPLHFSGPRSCSTAIYFLLPSGSKSALHRIKSDEVWHFYLGDSLTLVQISPEGECQQYILGQNIVKGEKLQHTVPAGYWFGAYPNSNSSYSFVGCTVAPGFDFADFELGEKSQLLQQFPQHAPIIEKLTVV